MLEICKRKGRLKWFVKQPYPPLAQVAYSSRICSKYLYKKKEEKLTLEDQVFRLILRINSSELYSNIYGSASTHRVNLPFFSSPPFPSVKFMKNGIFGQETFVARRKTAFLDRKLLSLGEKWRFWTGNFCCSEKNGVFGQKTFVAWRKTAFLDRKLLLLGEKWRFWTGNFCRLEKNGVFGQETFVARGRSEFFSIFKT